MRASLRCYEMSALVWFFHNLDLAVSRLLPSLPCFFSELWRPLQRKLKFFDEILLLVQFLLIPCKNLDISKRVLVSIFSPFKKRGICVDWFAGVHPCTLSTTWFQISPPGGQVALLWYHRCALEPLAVFLAYMFYFKIGKF